MQAVVCIKWKCTSTEYEIRFIAYEFDSNTWRFRLCQLSQHWTGRRGWQYMQWDFLSVYHSVWAHACLCVCVCVCVCVCARRSVSALWWETMVFSAACCCWQAPTLSAMRRTAASQACRGVSHVPVAPLISFASPPPCVQSHRYTASDINPLHPLCS